MSKRSSSKLSVGVKASIVYTFSSLLAKGLAVITLPLFTRIMPPDQIGVVSLFNSWQTLIAGFATLSLTSGGFMLAMKDFKERRDQYTSSVLTLSTLIAIVLLILIIVFHNPIERVMGLPTSLCVLMGIGFVFMPAYDFWISKQRYEYHYKAVGVLTIASSLLSTGAAVVAVVLASADHVSDLGETRVFATCAVIYIFSGILWVYLFMKGRTFVDLSFWRYSLALSLPLVGNTIAAQVLSVSDRVMIDWFVGDAAVGIYGTLYSVSTLVLIVWNAINNSFVPFLYENLDKEGGQRRIRTVSSEVIIGFGALSVLLALLAPEILRLLTTQEYYNAVDLVPPIVAGISMTSIANLYSNLLIFYKKTKFIMLSSIVAAVINVILNLYFIPRYGYVAAAYTTLCAYAFYALIQGIVANRACKETWPKGPYNNILLGVIGSMVVVACLFCLVLYSSAVLRYGILFVFFVTCVIFRKRLMACVSFFRRQD